MRLAAKLVRIWTVLGVVALAAGLTACPPDDDETCSYDGQIYDVGESFPATDGCNTCSCMEGGLVGCTKMACVTTCQYDGETYLEGASFPASDGCNTCTCTADGTVGCTEMACLGCSYGGQGYVVGQVFPATDGCNTCVCQVGGDVVCTKKGCVCDPDTQWSRNYVGTPESCPVIYFVCPENTTYFSSPCGCGCEQDASCPQWINCMPPTPVPCSELQAACPYSSVAW